MSTIRQFLNDLDRNVQQTRVSMAMKLANGSTSTMESYHRQVGRMEGMGDAVKLARDMLGQMEAAQDDSGLPEMPHDREQS